MAKIYKLKTKKGGYKVDVTDKNGVRHRSHFAKKNEASAFVSRIEKEKADLKLIKRGLIKPKFSILKAKDNLLESKDELSEGTLKKYENILLQFEIFCNNKNIIYIDEFTDEDADEFFLIIKNSGANSKTKNSYLSLVKNLFHLQIRRKRIKENPFSHIDNFKIKKKSMLERDNDYYNESEIKNFFSQEMDESYRNAFVGLFLTGMRFEEMASLKWPFVLFESHTIQIRNNSEFTTKTETSERDIPMTSLLKQTLQNAKSKSRSEYVFPSINNNKMSERTLLQVCKRIAKKAGIIKNATLHKWRHTYATMCQQIGITYEERQQLLGHKPQSMTDHYTKIDPTKSLHKLNKLDEYIN